MTTMFAPDQLIGHTAVDPNGKKLGKIGQIYLHDQTGQPAWVTVSTGMFGTRESFAPLYGASMAGDDLVLRVTKDQMKDAPNIDADAHIDEDEQQALWDYYAGLFTTEPAWSSWQAGQEGEPPATPNAGKSGRVGGPGRDVSGPNTDTAMTRSEERLRVGKEQVQTGRARLRKYVVTENVSQVVPVSREEVRLEREPITEGNVDAATSGAEISEEEHEVTLHAERPVIGKETTPVERVRLDTETVTDQETVDETVRKEQIDLEGDTGRG